MPTSRTLRPVSLFNRIYGPLLLACAAVALWRGVHGTAAIALLMCLTGAWSVHRARQGLGSVSERVNAVQPYDERDAALVHASFAILGMAVLVAQTVMFFVALVRGVDATGELLRLAAVCGIGFVATEIAVRRG